MSAKAYATLAAVIFTLLALAQLVRAYMGVEVLAGGVSVPIVASWVAGPVLLVIALLGFTAKR